MEHAVRKSAHAERTDVAEERAPELEGDNHNSHIGVTHAGVKRAAAHDTHELEATTIAAAEEDADTLSDAAAIAAELLKSADGVVLPSLAATRSISHNSTVGDTHAAFSPSAAPPPPPPAAEPDPSDVIQAPVKQGRRKLTPAASASAAFRAAIIDRCKFGDLDGAFNAYDAMCATTGSITISAHVYNAVLNLCTRATGGVSRDVLGKAVRVFNDMTERGIPANEAAYTSMIRLAAAAGDGETSVKFFQGMRSKGMQPRLRTYAPLLQLYARSGQCDRAVELYADMRATGVEPQQPEFGSILTALGKCGRHRDVHAILQRVSEGSNVGEYAVSAFTHACTRYFTGQLDAIGAGHGLEPMTAVHGEEWAAAEAAGAAAPQAVQVQTDARPGVLVEYPTAARDAASWPWTCARVRIDPMDGMCPYTQRRLRSLEVSPDEHAMLVQQVSALALKSPKQFDFFKEWLARHGPFDVIVDGANVGFFNQNFAEGGLMYTQIEAVVRAFERMGKRVLIIISKRWLDPDRFAKTDARRPSGIKRRRDGAVAGSGAPVAVPSSAAGLKSAAVVKTGAATEVAAVEPAAASDDVDPDPASARAPRRANRGVVYDGTSLASALAHEDDEPAAAVSTSSAEQIPSVPPPRDTALNWWGVLASTSAGHGDSTGSSDEDDSSGDDMDTYANAATATAASRAASSSRVASNLLADSRVAPGIIERWTEGGIAFRVPPGGNDDWYWLYAALMQQTPASTVIVSNDLMRDHHFQMLAPLAFLRWRERHQVFFSFEFNTAQRRVQPVFQYPRIYSHRVQVAEDGSSWHLPILGSTNEWLVAKRRM